METGDRRGHQEEVREYYRTVSGFIDRELVRRGDADFWREVVAASPAPPRVLELGAGTGRITAILAEGAAEVVALDLSLPMLRRARERLKDRPRVRLLATDMRQPALAGRFDLVVAADDPFVHLLRDEDRDRALGVVARSLAPGGRFVLDAHRLPEDAVRAAGAGEGFRREREVGTGCDHMTVRERWRREDETHTYRAWYEYYRDGVRLDGANFRARLWSARELEDRLLGAGLRLEHLWGDFDRRPWDPGSAPHLMAQAVQPGLDHRHSSETRTGGP